MILVMHPVIRLFQGKEVRISVRRKHSQPFNQIRKEELKGMITISDKARDALMLAAAVCWGFVVFASWEGALSKNNELIYYGLIAGAVLVVIYYLMGAVINEKMSVAVLVWPALLNGITQIVAFTIVYTTKGQQLDFIWGMHPGFLGAMIFFWLGNFVCSTLSYWVLFDRQVIPDETWDVFMKEVAAQEKLH
jgi:FtsH-binding integral membrane protein